MLTQEVFREPGYLRHNKARLEHLASLNLPIEGRSVLVLGAGIGCHVPFFLERGCNVTVTDGRPENVEFMRREHPDWDVYNLDVEQSPLPIERYHEIVFCYGLLYHCSKPFDVIYNIASLSPELLLLETCVAQSDSYVVKTESLTDPRCSLVGIGNRRPRFEILQWLKGMFNHVYLPTTQPDHEEFPEFWNEPLLGECRAIFIASAEELSNPLLTTELPMIQTRYTP